MQAKQVSSVLILLRALAVLSDDVKSRLNVTSWGHESCPCITYSVGANDTFVSDSTDINVEVATVNYGIGCRKHDAFPPFVEKRCGSDEPPEYCNDGWCYTVPDCQVDNQISLIRPGRQYSYGTCGYLDRYETLGKATSLTGVHLNIVQMTNSGGWKGVYCPKGKRCSGPVYELLRYVVGEAGAVRNTIQTFSGGPLTNYPDAAFPTQLYDQLKRHYPKGQKSTFTACTYAAALGYVDICLGAFAQTPYRQLISHMIPLYVEPLYLVSALRDPNPTFWDFVAKAFRPFKPSLWFATVCFFIFVSFLTTFLEKNPDGMYHEHSIFSAITHSLYRSAASVVDSGHVFIVTSHSSRFAQLGLGFFLLLATSAYTANLASFLILQERALSTIGSWDEVLADNRIKVCSLWTMTSMLTTSLRLPEDQHAPLLSRNDVISSIGTSTCEVGVLTMEDLEKAQQGGNFCNLVRVGEPLLVQEWGAPVSRRVASTLQYILADAKSSGVFNAMLNSGRPPPSCAVREKMNIQQAMTLGLELREMAGPFFIAGFFIIVGLITSCIQYKFGKQMADVYDKQATRGKNLWSNIQPVQGVRPMVSDTIHETLNRFAEHAAKLDHIIGRAHEEERAEGSLASRRSRQLKGPDAIEDMSEQIAEFSELAGRLSRQLTEQVAIQESFSRQVSEASQECTYV